MSVFKNKHIVMAMVISPILAIGAYYLTDALVGEIPHAAKTGEAYRLIAQSNCRYASGRCDLKNAEFEAYLSVDVSDGEQVFTLVTNHPLQGATIGIVNADRKELPPRKLTAVSSDQRRWSQLIETAMNANTAVRLVLTANEVHYYAETTLGFVDYQTSFNKDFRR